MSFMKRLSLIASVIRGDARLLWKALRHPQSPGWLKLGVAATVIYLLSPLDLIPEVVPVLGVVDDVVLVPLAIAWMLRRLPERVRADIGARGEGTPTG